VVGDLMQLTVGQNIEGLLGVGGQMRTVRLGGDLSGSLEVDGDLGIVQLAALSGRLQGLGQMRSLRINGNLSGEAFIFRSWRQVMITGGDLSGSIGGNEEIFSVQIKAANDVGGALTGSIEAGDRIGTVRTEAAGSGLIEAPSITNVTFTGGFDGDIRAEGNIAAQRGDYNIGTLRVTGGNLLGTVTADSIRTLQVRDGDVGAVVTVNGNLGTFRLSGATGGNMLTGSGLTVTGNLNLAQVSGHLTGVWDLQGPVNNIRHTGTADEWTLQTPANERTSVRSLQLGEIDQMALTGLANIRTFRSRAIADGTLGANSIGTLTCDGQLLADLTLAGNELNESHVLNNARIRGDITNATWQLTGTVGTISLDGHANGFGLIASDSVNYFYCLSFTDRL